MNIHVSGYTTVKQLVSYLNCRFMNAPIRAPAAVVIEPKNCNFITNTYMMVNRWMRVNTVVFNVQKDTWAICARFVIMDLDLKETLSVPSAQTGY